MTHYQLCERLDYLTRKKLKKVRCEKLGLRVDTSSYDFGVEDGSDLAAYFEALLYPSGQCAYAAGRGPHEFDFANPYMILFLA